VIAISSDTRNRARRYYGIERPIRVIPYGFRAPRKGEGDGEPPIGDDTFRLIAVGRLVARKGFDHLLRALPDLPSHVRLEVVGDGPLAAPLRDLSRELGVEDRVSWPGYLGRGEILRRLARSDCFVLSSLHEGLGIAVQEAMFSGLPIVATDNGGQTDLVEHGGNGLLVPVADPGAIASAVRELLDDAPRREKMGEVGRAKIAELSLQSNAEEVLGVCRQAMASGTG